MRLTGYVSHIHIFYVVNSSFYFLLVMIEICINIVIIIIFWAATSYSEKRLNQIDSSSTQVTNFTATLSQSHKGNKKQRKVNEIRYYDLTSSTKKRSAIINRDFLINNEHQNSFTIPLHKSIPDSNWTLRNHLIYKYPLTNISF